MVRHGAGRREVIISPRKIGFFAFRSSVTTDVTVILRNACNDHFVDCPFVRKMEKAMKKLVALLVAASAFAASLPLAATAQELTVVRERTRVCYDSYGDRVPCGRRYYRSYDDGYYYGDRYYYGGRNRDRPAVGLQLGPLGLYLD
jgi:hypothetical protein